MLPSSSQSLFPYFKNEPFLLFFGPNGSGKSSYLQFLWNQLHPQKKERTFFLTEKETPPYDLSWGALQKLVQNTSLFSSKKFENLLHQFNLKHLPYEGKIHHMSSGEWQKIRLSLCFSNTSYEAYFLDEPDQFLDQKSLENLEKNCQEILKEKKTLFLISHRLFPNQIFQQKEGISNSSFQIFGLKKSVNF